MALEQLEETVLRYGRTLADKPPIAVQMCKKCINIAADSSMQVGLWAEEIQGIYTASTSDKKEASLAMAEKRKGNYTYE